MSAPHDHELAVALLDHPASLSDEDTGGFPPFDDDDGDVPRGCAWDEYPCTNLPSHYIHWAGHICAECADNPDVTPTDRAAHADAELFCERHYLAVMLYLFEVRLPSYRLTLGDLVADFGTLSSE